MWKTREFYLGKKQPRSFRVLVIFPNKTNKKKTIVLQNECICVQSKYPRTIETT